MVLDFKSPFHSQHSANVVRRIITQDRRNFVRAWSTAPVFYEEWFLRLVRGVAVRDSRVRCTKVDGDGYSIAAHRDLFSSRAVMSVRRAFLEGLGMRWPYRDRVSSQTVSEDYQVFTIALCKSLPRRLIMWVVNVTWHRNGNLTFMPHIHTRGSNGTSLMSQINSALLALFRCHAMQMKWGRSAIFQIT
jgi:hypothetical protein